MATEAYQNIYLYKKVVLAKLFIDRNFADKIDLDNISDEAYFSKFHFIRLFNSIYAKTPHQYLTQVRIEKAKHFLRHNNSVSNTYCMVGYDSISSFIELLKKRMMFKGQAPKQMKELTVIVLSTQLTS